MNPHSQSQEPDVTETADQGVGASAQRLEVAKVLAEASHWEWGDLEINQYAEHYLLMAGQTIAQAAAMGVSAIVLATFEAQVRASERQHAAWSVEAAADHMRRVCGEKSDSDDYTSRVYRSCASDVRREGWLELEVGQVPTP